MAYYQPEDRRPPTTPQLALRVAALGFVALALFAIVFFRLWYLQVLAGDQYLAEANQNRGARGADRGAARRHRRPQRQGDRQQPAGQRRPDQPALALPGGARRGGDLGPGRHGAGQAVARRPAAHRPLAGQAPAGHARRCRRCPRSRGAAAALHRDREGADDAPDDDPEARRALAGDAALRRDHAAHRRPALDARLPRGAQDRVPRRAPQRGLPAPVPQGHARRAAAGQRRRRSRPSRSRTRASAACVPGTVVGKSGIELAYDRYLRGRDGTQRLQVDALGQFKGELAARAARPGGRPPDQALARPRPAARRPGRAAAGDRRRQRERDPLAGRRVRGDEPGQRRDLRDGLGAVVRPDRCSPSRSPTRATSS